MIFLSAHWFLLLWYGTITSYYKRANIFHFLTPLIYWPPSCIEPAKRPHFGIEDDWNTSECPANKPLSSHMLLLSRNPTLLSSSARRRAQTISFARMPWARSDLSKYQNHWRGWKGWSLCVVSRHFYEKQGLTLTISPKLLWRRLCHYQTFSNCTWRECQTGWGDCLHSGKRRCERVEKGWPVVSLLSWLHWKNWRICHHGR